MSAASVHKGLVAPELPGNSYDAHNYVSNDGGAARRAWLPSRLIAPTGWRRQLLETFAFLAVIVVLQRRWSGVEEIPGLPHPYWLPVLLASCQYGVRGGMVAAVAASAVYWFALPPASAAQDFYTYAGTVAVHPATWLATALVVGGLRNLHMHQYAELTDDLAASRLRASDLGEALEGATAEINALERRVASDMSSLAAVSRSLSLIDLSDRRAAAMSCGELFRIGSGARTFTIYLKDRDGYAPVWAIENDAPHSIKSIPPLPLIAIESMKNESASRIAEVRGTESAAGRYLVSVPSLEVGAPPLAAIVCELQSSQDAKWFHRRANELGRAFATILYACPNPPAEPRS
jgi:K+-sensing histidine kinase KdpD